VHLSICRGLQENQSELANPVNVVYNWWMEVVVAAA